MTYDEFGKGARTVPQKIIHEPSDAELVHLAQCLSDIEINGADRVLLIWGRAIFKEDWISDTTKNWLGVFDADVLKYEESYDEQDQRIFAVMVELDYKALKGSVFMDAQYATAKIEDAEGAKGIVE